MPSTTDDPDEALNAPDTASERRSTNLELFLDLVFVFAITQVATALASNTTALGTVQGLLLAWLVWWLWSQFAWLGTAIDLEADGVSGMLVLAAVPPTLLMAVGLAQATTGPGREFAFAYFFVQLWALFIQGRGLWGEEATRNAFVRYVPIAAVAPALLVLGSFLEPWPRTAIWAIVMAFNIVGAILAGRDRPDRASEWRINPTHFSERHALFVIISFGEVLVAVGASASAGALSPQVASGLIGTVVVACVLWWAYFGFIPRVTETTLRNATGSERGKVARNLLSFGHFPIVLGIVLFAVAAKHIVPDPWASLHTRDILMLTAAITLFVGGLLGMQWQVVRRLAPERLATIGIIAVMNLVAGPRVPAEVLIGAIAAILIGMQFVTLRRFRRSNLHRQITNSTTTT